MCKEMLRCELECYESIPFNPKHIAIAAVLICNAKDILHDLSDLFNKRRFWDKKGLCNDITLIVSNLA